MKIIGSESIKYDVTSPFLTTVFYVLAALGFLGGIIMCVIFWPDSSDIKILKLFAYSPSIAWLTAGIIEAAIFSAIGLGLRYLKAICVFLKTININTKRTQHMP